MMIDISERRWTVSRIAEVLDVPLGTVRNWSQRGHLPASNRDKAGSWRRFSLLDIAEIAAIHQLSLEMGPTRATKVLSIVTGRQSELWSMAVENATEQPLDMWVQVIRSFGSGSLGSVFFYVGGSPWHSNVLVKGAKEVMSLAYYNIGPAVCTALKKAAKDLLSLKTAKAGT